MNFMTQRTGLFPPLSCFSCQHRVNQLWTGKPWWRGKPRGEAGAKYQLGLWLASSSRATSGRREEGGDVSHTLMFTSGLPSWLLGLRLGGEEVVGRAVPTEMKPALHP